ncbi:unnamed protein product [Cylindrotheca closterium]|uniref:Methyltransferase domain-containing protein n=1 Tax=Cylindrotheca closterium TaxID=2856 RepID=A0AAD2CJL7_9STRA|nr:unnamed protein product [Cylindrotheca closterium]
MFQSTATLWNDNSTMTRNLCETVVETPIPSAATGQPMSQSGFSFAQRQSFGYFDDISDENWKRAQQIHAKMFPNHSPRLGQYSNALVVKDKMAELKMSSFWYAQNFHKEFHCPLAQRIPTDGEGDGPKWACDPHRLKDKKDCLVYSIGSNGKAEFETGVKDEIGNHCEIHTFDVGNYNKRNGNFAEALKGIATFHHWGFGTKEEAQEQPRRFKTLQQTMKELGHANRTIDLFKIDCEWCEWFSYEQWLNQDIRQILVETHNAPMPNVQDFFLQIARCRLCYLQQGSELSKWRRRRRIWLPEAFH